MSAYPNLEEIIRQGQSYTPDWKLTPDELEVLCAEAEVEMCTMNGDTGTIEITVKQFAQLVSAYAQQTNILDEDSTDEPSSDFDITPYHYGPT